MELVDELREEIESNVWSHWGIDELPSEEDVYVWVDMLLKLHLDMSPKYAALKEEVDREAFKKSVVDKYHHEQSCKQQVGGCIVFTHDDFVGSGIGDILAGNTADDDVGDRNGDSVAFGEKAIGTEDAEAEGQEQSAADSAQGGSEDEKEPAEEEGEDENEPAEE